MVGIAKNLKRTAELLSPKGRMQDNENLDHLNRTVRALCDCTHPVKFMYVDLNVMLDSFDGLVKVVLWIVNYLRVGKAGDPALQGR